MAKIQKKDGSLVIKKNFWSAISIWWAIIVFLIAIPGVLFIGFVQLDYNPYMDGLMEYAKTKGIDGNLEMVFNAYKAALKEGKFASYETVINNGQVAVPGLFLITTRMVDKMEMTFKTLNTLRLVATVAALAIFVITLVYLISKLVCAKKTAWTFYDGAVIYKKGKIFYTEEYTRDMDFFPGMSVSVRRTLKGKILGYGDVIVSNGAGEAGEIILDGVKKPKKAQKALRELIAMNCTYTANMMSPYKMYPQMYRNVLGGYPAYYYGAMQSQSNQTKK